MADKLERSPLAPQNPYPERVGNVFERKMAPDAPGGRGPMRFEEGLGTDTDLPNEFAKGIMQGYQTPAGRPNHNENVYEKYPEETLRERVHVGSAAWTQAPLLLSGYVAGSSNEAEQKYIQEDRSGGRYERHNPAQVQD